MSNGVTRLERALTLVRDGFVPPEVKYIVVDDFSTYGFAVNAIEQYKGVVAVDIESGGNIKDMYPWEMPLLCVSVTVEQNTFVFAESTVRERSLTLVRLMEALALPNKFVVGHNFQFDSMTLWKASGVRLVPKFDTFIAHHTLHQNASGSHSLKSAAQGLLGAPDWETEKDKYLLGGAHFERIPKHLLHEYAANDTYWTFELYKYFKDKVNPITFNHVMKASHFFQDVQDSGFAVDMKYTRTLKESLEVEIQEIRDIMPTDLNLNSPKQVKEHLESLGLKVDSTDAKTLQKITEGKIDSTDQAKKFATNLSQLRKVEKSLSGFVESVLKWQRDGVVYPSVNVCGTVTGRVSSSNPNIHQQPRDPRYRSMWTACSKDHVIVASDFSQAELRVMATLSEDKWLQEKLRSDEDFFDSILPDMFLHLDKSVLDDPIVAKEYRTRLKTVIYGLAFSRGPAAIAEELEISVQEARDIVNRFLSNAHNLRDWRKQIEHNLESGNPIVTPFGRTFDKEIIAGRKDFETTLRSALSFMPQSTASDICIQAAMTADEGIRLMGGKIVATVHDSIISCVPKNRALEAAEYTVHVMEETGFRWMGDFVPFKADWEYGPSWGKPTKVMK